MIIQVTFKSGTQQFFELDDDDYISLQECSTRFNSEDHLPFFTSSTGAIIDLNEVAGCQHVITRGQAYLWASGND